MLQRQWSDLNLWLMLGSAVFIAGWLVPDHRAPWPAFYSEALAAAGLLPLAIWSAAHARASLEVPRSAILFTAIAVVPLLQLAFGQIRYWGDAALAFVYLAAFAMAIVAGAHWRQTDGQSMASRLALTAAVGSFLTLGLASMQWLQIDDLGVLLASLPPHSRPTGNIAQANHMATLLAWGVLAIWMLYELGRIRGPIAMTATLPLLFGVAMSQSRTGWIELGVMACAAIALKRRCVLRVPALPVIVLTGLFAITVVSWQSINQALGMAPALTLEQRVAAGPRLQIWQQFATALLQSPWVGYGWTQGGLAQQAAVPLTPPLHLVSSYSHNLVLDLMLWNGAPLGVLITGAIAFWSIGRARQVADAESLLFGLALLVLAVHAMFEFPHAYAYFLLPAGLMVGALEAASLRPCVGPKPRRRGALAVTGLLAGALTLMTIEYTRIEESLIRYRFEAARVGSERGSTAPNVLLLDQLGALMRFVRTQPVPDMSPAELAGMQEVVARFPSSSNQFRMALAMARNGRPLMAAESLRQLCAMQRRPQCQPALDAWAAVAVQDAAVRGVDIGDLGTAAVR